MPPHPIMPVQARPDKFERTFDAAFFKRTRYQRLDQAGNTVDSQKHGAQPVACRIDHIVAFFIWRAHEQLGDADLQGISGLWLKYRQDHQRHHHDPRPIRHFVYVKRCPARQQHRLDPHYRHRTPRHLPEKCQGNPREHVRFRRPAVR